MKHCSVVFFVFLACLTCSLPGLGQGSEWKPTSHNRYDLRLSIPARIEPGLNFASVSQNDQSVWNQSLGTVVNFSSGIGLRVKQRLCLSLEGGLTLDTYNFLSSYASYSITHFLPEVRLNLSYLFPLRGDASMAIAVGAEGGWSFTGYNLHEASDPRYTIRSETFGPANTFFAPELGFARRWSGGQMRFLLTYLMHQRDTPVFTTQITEADGGELTAQSSGNYLGLRIIGHFDVRGHKAPKNRYTETPDLLVDRDFESRQTRTRKELKVKGRRLVVKLWDNADVDGDTISVKLNGRYVLTAHPLTKKKARLVLILEPGQNSLVIHAHNEGRVPPNTAASTLRSGFLREKLVFSSGLSRNEEVVIDW